ncbi:hypothetical protein AVEN_241748-1, partial [Araneus ventricosus]
NFGKQRKISDSTEFKQLTKQDAKNELAKELEKILNTAPSTVEKQPCLWRLPDLTLCRTGYFTGIHENTALFHLDQRPVCFSPIQVDRFRRVIHGSSEVHYRLLLPPH